jgi:hypothetical protein
MVNLRLGRSRLTSLEQSFREMKACGGEMRRMTGSLIISPLTKLKAGARNERRPGKAGLLDAGHAKTAQRSDNAL